MPEPKRIMCRCGEEIALCTRCGFQPVEHETTDQQYLCAGCAQDSHIPCGSCGDVVPAIEADDDGTCLDCNRKEARLLWQHGKTEKERTRGEVMLNAYGAMIVLIHVQEDAGLEGVADVKMSDVLYGLRRLLRLAELREL